MELSQPSWPPGRESCVVPETPAAKDPLVKKQVGLLPSFRPLSAAGIPRLTRYPAIQSHLLGVAPPQCPLKGRSGCNVNKPSPACRRPGLLEVHSNSPSQPTTRREPGSQQPRERGTKGRDCPLSTSASNSPQVEARAPPLGGNKIFPSIHFRPFNAAGLLLDPYCPGQSKIILSSPRDPDRRRQLLSLHHSRNKSSVTYFVSRLICALLLFRPEQNRRLQDDHWTRYPTHAALHPTRRWCPAAAGVKVPARPVCLHSFLKLTEAEAEAEASP